MSKETLDQFIQKVTDSEELQVRVGEEIETDALIALGTEHGCEFSAEDIQAVWGVSDDDLDGVVGGAAYIKYDGVRGGFAVGKQLQRSHQIGNKYKPGKGFRDITDGTSNT
tara:strand:- start:122 stop:454 length:333 start_codon:yes stop_codon:yes gene_type:complete